MKSILLKIRYLYLGIKSINKLNIADIVVYNDENYWLSSYKSTDNDNSNNWSMINLKTKRYEIHNEKDIRKPKNLRNIKNAIKGTYRFYMINWHRIIKENIKYKDIFRVTEKNFFELTKKYNWRRYEKRRYI